MWNVQLPDAEWYDYGDPRLEAVVREVCDKKEVAIDTETTGLVVYKDMPLFWSLSWDERRLCMPTSTLAYFRDAFRDTTKKWIFANAKFDMHMLGNAGVHFAGECVDTQVMHALLYEEESHALKDMAKSILGWRWNDFFDQFKLGIRPDGERESIGDMLLRFQATQLDALVEYASNDAYGTLQIYRTLKKALEETRIFSLYPDTYATMADLFFKVEVPFTTVLWNCERRGVYVNGDYLNKIETPLREELDYIAREINRIAGRVLNPNSPKQMREYFFGELKLQPRMYTKGGKSGVKEPSVDSGFMDHYAEEGVEMCKVMVRQRELSKILGTYVLGLGSRMDTWGRVHTRFNQDIARTGRLSSSDPNMQNIPRADDDEFKLRGAIQTQPGAKSTLIVGDYEQLEMRLLACATVTKDCPKGAEAMIDIFLSGKDIHMGNAALVFGPIYERKHGWRMTYDDLVYAKKIDKKVKSGELGPEAMTERVQLALFARQAAKAIGFGLNYGMKENKLSRSINSTKEEALALIDAYLGTYPAVSQFYEDAKQVAYDTGYSFTLLGRRRFHPEITSSRNTERWEAERKAVNNAIQGTAADAARLAMISIFNAKLDEKYGCHMLLQVHDELMFECPEETADQALAEIKHMMEHPFPTDLAVPLDVSIGKGPAWDKAK